MTSTDDSLDDSSSGMCNGNGAQSRKSRFRRRKPKKTQRLSNEHSIASPGGSDNMDIDDSIVKSLDEAEIESNNARRSAEQLGADSCRNAQPPKYLAIERNEHQHDEPNGINCMNMNFEDVIPLSKTKIPQSAGLNGIDRKDTYPKQTIETDESREEVAKADVKTTIDDAQNSLDYTKNHLDKSRHPPEDDCDIDKIAEIVSQTVSENESVPFAEKIPLNQMGVADNETPSEETNGVRNDAIAQDEDKPLLPYAEAKIPNTSSPIPPSETKETSYEEIESSLEKMFAGVEEEYKSFETSLSPTKKTACIAENTKSTEAAASKQEPADVEAGDSAEQKSNGTEDNSGNSKDDGKGSATSSSGSNVTASNNNGPQRQKKAAGRKIGKKSTNGKMNKSKGGTMNKGNKKRGRPSIKNNGSVEKKARVKEETTATADALNKFRGPYVQIERDGSETVINAPITEEVAEKQGKLKKTFAAHNVSDRSKIRGLHVSTLSHKYDAATTDKSWMCVFCKLGPHKYCLGDLFGPYILTTNGEDFLLSQIDPSEDVFKSRRTKADMIQSRGMTIVVAKGHLMNGEGTKVFSIFFYHQIQYNIQFLIISNITKCFFSCNP